MNHSLRQVRIVHVSDPHFGPEHRFLSELQPDGTRPPARGIPTLADSLFSDLSGPAFQVVPWLPDANHPVPVLLALTGDLTQAGSTSEFDEAKNFIAAMRARPLLGHQLGAENVLVVPGNHDLHYAEPDLGRRWYPFCRFYKATTQRHAEPEEPNRLTRVHDRSLTEHLVIAEINSCVDIQKGTAEQNRGYVDDDALDQLEQQLKAVPTSRLKDSVKIALLHHHPVVLPALAEAGRGYDGVANGQMLLGILRRYGFHIVLHGHKHYPHVFSYDALCAWTSESEHPLIVVAGGSAGAAESGLPAAAGSPATNTYNVIALKWDEEAQHGRIQVVTRGLVFRALDGTKTPGRQWYWKTLRTYDRVFMGTRAPEEKTYHVRAFDRIKDGEFDDLRRKKYADLRGNMLVANVFPSMHPNQGYEVQVWIVPHSSDFSPLRELPVEVEWSAGEKFREVRLCRAVDDDRFAASFSYWEGALIQARMRFRDGTVTVDCIYAHKPR